MPTSCSRRCPKWWPAPPCSACGGPWSGSSCPAPGLAYTVGPALARVFEQRYGCPFAVVRNVSRLRPADAPLPPAPAAAPPGGYLLYQGALNVGRGLEALLRSHART